MPDSVLHHGEVGLAYRLLLPEHLYPLLQGIAVQRHVSSNPIKRCAYAYVAYKRHVFFTELFLLKSKFIELFLLKHESAEHVEHILAELEMTVAVLDHELEVLPFIDRNCAEYLYRIPLEIRRLEVEVHGVYAFLKVIVIDDVRNIGDAMRAICIETFPFLKDVLSNVGAYHGIESVASICLVHAVIIVRAHVLALEEQGELYPPVEEYGAVGEPPKALRERHLYPVREVDVLGTWNLQLDSLWIAGLLVQCREPLHQFRRVVHLVHDIHLIRLPYIVHLDRVYRVLWLVLILDEYATASFGQIPYDAVRHHKAIVKRVHEQRVQVIVVSRPRALWRHDVA